MTISSETRKAGPYSANGSTVTFPFSFKCFSTEDVSVVLTDDTGIETTLTLSSEYSVSLNADQNTSPGGSITTLEAYELGNKVTIVGDIDYEQNTDITNGGGFYPEVIENALDKLTMQIQQVNDKADRAVKVEVSSSVPPEQYLSTVESYKAEAQAAASAASGSESAAAASEASALASKTAAETAEANAETAEAAAEAAQAAAATSASGAATSATNAANSATAAATSATSASNSASAASTSATNAATSATNAASSATGAAASASAAAAAYDSFDDRYLGAKTADPALDNDGNALMVGALYFNSVLAKMRVYSGSVWGDVSASTSFNPQSFSGTGAQTAFTLTQSPGAASALFVYVSGIRQTPTTDYTLSGTTLTFTTAPPSGTNNIFTLGVTAHDIGTPSDGTVSTAKIVDAAVTTDKVADGAITLAKLATAIGTVASQAEMEAGTESALRLMSPLRVKQAIGALAGTIKSGSAVNSTSGTAIDFTGIPAGVKRITVMFNGVSTNGSSNLLVQIGDSGGIEITGYSGGSFNFITAANSTIGFDLTCQNAATVIWGGSITLNSLSGNIWTESGVIHGTGAGFSGASGGTKTLSDTLDRIRITTVNGTDTFDAGSINILYE